ncbi:MAG: RNA methyltransferase [Nitrospinae bacterium]|nr:RNA methyltransferase [Nitrospinota bacterium]
MTGLGARLAVGLVHYPVLNKAGETVTSSVTTLDIHDLARVCRTYGVGSLYIITPLPAQARLAERVARHWTQGFGADYNPSRAEALGILKVVDSIDTMLDNLRLDARRVAVAVTSARAVMNEWDRVALLFGTAHGLADSVMERAGIALEPIEGAPGFNHLPVRCAAAVILDRLLGSRGAKSEDHESG